MTYTDISESKWQLVYDQHHESLVETVAVPPFEIPQQFFRHLVRVHFEADQTPARWFQAGHLVHRLDDGTGTPIDYESIIIPQNRMKVIKFDPLADRYRLEFRPFNRYLWFDFKLWFHVDFM